MLPGFFAVAEMPHEEPLQIDITMADLLIPFPGAAVRGGPPPATRDVWNGVSGRNGAAPADYPVVTLTITK